MAFFFGGDTWEDTRRYAAMETAFAKRGTRKERISISGAHLGILFFLFWCLLALPSLLCNCFCLFSLSFCLFYRLIACDFVSSLGILPAQVAVA